MNLSQREEASILAAKALDAGADPEGMVHILYYPDNYLECEESIQGISTPITFEKYASGGYTCKYYALSELAKQTA